LGAIASCTRCHRALHVDRLPDTRGAAVPLIARASCATERAATRR
jgi:hypothetical protein